ncbi:MAG: hypothetical protein WBK77_08155 [Alphaproteobacteria bacterium]
MRNAAVKILQNAQAPLHRATPCCSLHHRCKRKPLGAYEIPERLGKKIKNPKPPTVYRAIEFWAEHGFIHRVESLNAYVACEAGHQHKSAQFMVCNDCGSKSARVVFRRTHGASKYVGRVKVVSSAHSG